MNQNNENINWEIMDDDQPKSLFRNPIKLHTSSQKPEKDYRNLYHEMLEKCNPALFLEPYNPKKLAVANSIYSILKQHEKEYNVLDKDMPQELRLLRNEAALSLEVSFTTKRLFKFLEKRVHPKQFVDANYNKELLDLSNEVYNELLQSSDDIISVEKFYKSERCQICLNQIEAFYKKIQEEEEKKQEEEDKMTIKILISFLVILLLGIGIPIIVSLSH